MKIHLICAARPNFMKIAPLYHALKKEDWADPIIVHTGQHYDLNLSDAIFQDLALPKPHIHLGIGSGTHAEQTGKVMIDSLEMLRSAIEQEAVYETFSLKPKHYGLVTLHRPSNVDNPECLKNLCDKLVRISDTIPLVFPVHPRTMKNLEAQDLLPALEKTPNLILTEPLSYIPFMNAVFNCRLIITDSGGIQEETTYLGIPCLTLRPNTERPITITHGTNQLCGTDELESRVEVILNGYNKAAGKLKYWDGKTAARIVSQIKSLNDFI